MIKSTFPSRALVTGFVLSFVGAKGCLGGDVSLGNDGTAGAAGNVAAAGGSATATTGGTGMGGAQASGAPCQLPTHPVACTGLSLGYNFDPQHGTCVPYCSSNASFTSLETCQATCATRSGGTGGSASGASTTDAPLSVDANGQVSSSPDFGISGPVYNFSDSIGEDGTSASGNCESAGHSAAECSHPLYLAPIPTSTLCTGGTVEPVLDIVGMPGTPDYASMWGAGMAFNFVQSGDVRLPYDASAHGVIGLAFDISEVPPLGMRVELTTPSTINEPRTWLPSQSPTPNFTSPVQVGHNVVLFQDVTAMVFYADQSALDPTQIVSVQFHVPTTNQAASYQFCISNMSLVLGTPPPPGTSTSCAPSIATGTGFEYSVTGACLSPYSTILSCPGPGTADVKPVVPSMPAIANLPCVHRLSDGALFVALSSSTGPLAWQTQPASTWGRLPTSAWGDCSADEAALVAAATVCPVTLP